MGSRDQLATSRAAGPGAELDRAEHESAERGFLGLLRRKRFSPAFIERHAADLLARAHLEYAKHVAAGEEISNPGGWIVHCAWRRTQNLLEQQGGEPRTVPIEADGRLAGEWSTPEEEVLAADRRRQLAAAVEELPEEERTVIALTYFEGMSVREVSRAMEWDKCKGDRRHRAALAHLQELLGVDDVDSLQIEIGILAWASLAAKDELPSPPAGWAHSAIDAGLAAIGRGQELARRLITGGAAEPGMGPAVGTAARTAGVCGAAAVACVASGLVGPGVGVDVLPNAGKERAAPQRKAAKRAELAPRTPIAPVEVAAEPPAAETTGGETQAATSSASEAKPAAQKSQSSEAASSPPAAASSQQVAEEFDPFVEGSGESSPGESAPSGSASDPSGSSESSPPSPRPAPRASARQVEAEFGF